MKYRTRWKRVIPVRMKTKLCSFVITLFCPRLKRTPWLKLGWRLARKRLHQMLSPLVAPTLEKHPSSKDIYLVDCGPKVVSLRSYLKSMRLVWENLNWLKENAYFKNAPRTSLFHSCGVKLENFALKSAMDVKLITLASANIIGALWQQMGKE